ncbi:hypothetical protein A3860_04990 [Niastella vici]|uniref:Methyltransferase domain-containing protein n=1 Tax=Niastella vici TaxID=1703345 RepID=A0A1V9FS41_9BACT|nr:class I SAM-dependent methyltransferase [Niastella vici]OQP61076.1 hypothetical protein A3860_04990 [Niastella vici]
MILKFLKKSLAGRRRSDWNDQYRKGMWDYLNDDLEAQRYDAIIQAVQAYGRNGYILEVGCGEGILQSRMPPGSYSSYLGIDISEVAIKKAGRLCDQTTQYVRADMETYIPKSRFDVIIFNESLYYAREPVKLLVQYAHFLKQGGHMILSIYDTEENRRLLNSIGMNYSIREQQVSTNQRGSWYCQVYLKGSILPKA